jgi:hypothetical protein
MVKYLLSAVAFTTVVSQASMAATSLNSLYLGAEQLGRGNAGLTSAKGADAIFYNPALVAPLSAEKDAEIVFPNLTMVMSTKLPGTMMDFTSTDTSAIVGGLKNIIGENRHMSASVFSGYITKKWSVGMLLSGMLNLKAYNSIEAAGLQAVQINAYQNIGLVGSYHHTLPGGVELGISPKIINRTQYFLDKDLSELLDIKDIKPNDLENSGTGFGANIGVSYKLPVTQVDSSVALTIDDLGGTTFKASKEITEDLPLDSLKQTVNLGGSATYRLGYPLTAEINIRDLLKNDETNFYMRTHLGLNYMLWDVLGLSTGFNQGYGSGGLFYQGANVRTYLGMYTQETGRIPGKSPDTRFYFKFEAAI